MNLGTVSLPTRRPFSWRALWILVVLQLLWYYMRLIIYVTPRRILWWDHADFSQAPHEMEVSHVG